MEHPYNEKADSLFKSKYRSRQMHMHSGGGESAPTNGPGFGEPPSRQELLLLTSVSAAAMWITAVVLHRTHNLIIDYGDNSAYLEVGKAIGAWDFHAVNIQHFMGYPYLIALVATIFHVPEILALWLIAALSSLASVFLTSRLFGGWVAGYFAFTNLAWLQLSFLGGSEPLAMALALSALLLFRQKQIFLAALLGSLAVIVRPLMVFILIGIGVVLFLEGSFPSFLVALGTAVVVAIVYMLPLAVYFGDPLLTVHTYTTRDYGAVGVAGPHGHLFGLPFHGIVAGTLDYPAPWTNLLLSFSWIGLVLVAVVMMFSRAFRNYTHCHLNETIFCSLYLGALFCYDYLIWARGNFMRFSIPILPFVFLAVLPLLPKDRRFLWSLSLIAAVLATFSAVGIRKVF
jgi:hypothetical protein